MKDPYKFGIRLLVIAGIALTVGLILFFFDVIAGVLALGIAVALGLSGYSVLKRYTAAVKTQEEIEAAKQKALEEEAAAETEEDEDEDEED